MIQTKVSKNYFNLLKIYKKNKIKNNTKCQTLELIENWMKEQTNLDKEATKLLISRFLIKLSRKKKLIKFRIFLKLS